MVCRFLIQEIDVLNILNNFLRTLFSDLRFLERFYLILWALALAIQLISQLYALFIKYILLS